MKYKLEEKIVTDLLNYPKVTEDLIFKELVFKMIKDIPTSDLKKLFNLKVIYGTADELRDAVIKMDEYKINKVNELITDQSTLFTGEIEIK